jgi:hypothetical protein
MRAGRLRRRCRALRDQGGYTGYSHVTWCFVVLSVVSFAMVACLVVRADFLSPHMLNASLRVDRGRPQLPIYAILRTWRSHGVDFASPNAYVQKGQLVRRCCRLSPPCRGSLASFAPLWSLGRTLTHGLLNGFRRLVTDTLAVPSHWT